MVARNSASRSRQSREEESEDGNPRRIAGNGDTNLLDLFGRLAVCSTAGVVFGIAIEKARVYEPGVIIDQMLMRRFLMLKVFLAAVASGMACMSLLSMIPATSSYFQKACTEYASALRGKGVLATALGGCILGCGMTIAGTCPGMVLAQIGAGTPNAVFTLAGALLAAGLYGVLEPTVMKYVRSTGTSNQQTLAQYSGAPYFILALPMASMIGLAVFGVEMMAPWKSELTSAVGTDGGVFTRYAWPPYVAGCLIGLMQVPIILVIGDTLGCSTSYCTVMSQALPTTSLQKLIPYLAKYRTGLDNWWQVVYVGSAVAGAFASSSLSHSYGTVVGVAPVSASLGGFLMVFGARMASGCTSGHGLSGMGLLQFLSFIAVPSMFAGGMATAFMLQKAGML